jgi:hypothetical protein
MPRPEIIGWFGPAFGETESGDGPGLDETGPALYETDLRLSGAACPR